MPTLARSLASRSRALSRIALELLHQSQAVVGVLQHTRPQIHGIPWHSMAASWNPWQFGPKLSISRLQPGNQSNVVRCCNNLHQIPDHTRSISKRIKNQHSVKTREAVSRCHWKQRPKATESCAKKLSIWSHGAGILSVERAKGRRPTLCQSQFELGASFVMYQ